MIEKKKNMQKITRTAESRCESYTKRQLEVLGWKLAKAESGGDVAEKQELRNHPRLRLLMKREAPEFVLFLKNVPTVAIECKAKKEDIDVACNEAQNYADKLKLKIAIGVAGNEEEGVLVRNFYRPNGTFQVVTHRGNPLTQILSKIYVERLIKTNRTEIDIDLPDENRFWSEADKIHNLLRNSNIPKQRMAAYLGTIILAFSENPQILKQSDFNDLGVLNTLAQNKLSGYHKPDLEKIFQIPDPSSDVFNNLKNNLPLIINSLQRLDVLPLLQKGVDILGKFFEQFLRYANDKKELGIVFTPRHIIDFMCQLADIQQTDKCLDPLCGTAGFLVSLFTIMREKLNKETTLTESKKKEELKKIKEERIFGTESESDGVIYGLACLNMIFRGDGNTNILHKDCFTQVYDFKFDKVLTNPPYSQSKKGTNGVAETKYLDYCLKNLKPNGLLCAIIPYSIMCDTSKWRKTLVKNHTVVASISVPAELFYPISAPAVIVLIKAHEPQNNKPIFLARIEDDGFEIDRQKRSKVKNRDGQQQEVLKRFTYWKALYDKQIYKSIDEPNSIITKSIADDDELLELVPEAHLRRNKITKSVIEKEIDFILRDQLCFQLKYADKINKIGFKQNKKRDVNVYLNRLELRKISTKPKIGKLSDFFEPKLSRKKTVYCEYGQKELHDKGWLKDGNDIIIASGGVENGLYGFYDFPAIYKLPVITCPSSGSICQAFVQELPCSAYDNTLVFIPKNNIEPELLYYVSAFIRLEAWRYRYGRQITPIRLSDLEIDLSYYDREAIKSFREHLPFVLDKTL